MMLCKKSIVYLIIILLFLNFISSFQEGATTQNKNIVQSTTHAKKGMSINEANQVALKKEDFIKNTEAKLNLIQKSEKTTKLVEQASPKKNKTKQCTRNIGLTKQVQKFIENPFLDSLDPKDTQKYTKNVPCEVKSGFIYILEKAKSYEKELKFTKVFIILNTKTIELLTSTDPKSLFREIPMDAVVKIGYKYKDTYCFDILYHENGDLKVEEVAFNKFLRNDMTLCGSNKLEMKEWINGILDMKSCFAKKTLADFSKLNKVLDLRPQIHEADLKAKRFISPLNYSRDVFKPEIHFDTKGVQKTTKTQITKIDDTQENTPIEHNSQSLAAAKIELANNNLTVKAAVNRIRETIKNAAIGQEKLKKELNSQLIKVKNERRNVKKERDIIQNLIQARKIAEEKAKEQYKTLLVYKRQAKILDLANKDIKKLKVYYFNLIF